MKNKKISSEQKRDITKDKKKLKKISLIILSALLSLGLLAVIFAIVLEYVFPDDTVSYADYRFYEADYSKNILEDEFYLSCKRGIHYNRYGDECVLTEERLEILHESATFFYDYFNNLVNGDYENHKTFYTEEYLNTDDEEKVFPIPEQFTMQGIYDIHVNLYSSTPEEDNPNKTIEIYEISYRIFENNGTFRRDILPEETKTLVYEIYIENGVGKINSIAYRATK